MNGRLKKDAGDADAVRRLRRLHWGGMLSNAALLVAIVGWIPYIVVGSSRSGRKGIDLTPKRRECVLDGDLSMFMSRVIRA